MLIIILILPLLGFFSGILFGRYLGKGVLYITCLNIFMSFIISLYFFSKILQSNICYKLILSSWIFSDSLIVDWSFCLDSLTSIMLIIVTFISFLVHLYSTEYMEHDPHKFRFMSYLSLFTFFMLILITANNFLQMFVGWEGVGLSSYLLINFWFTRIQANKAAIKAMLLNRVGDFFILLAFFVLYNSFNTLDYDIIFSLIPLTYKFKILILNFNFYLLDVICILLLIGAMGKSAQIGLHTWLPDAMEGPTPVSALIHAATMVTAGVFLITRCSYIFEFSPLALNLTIIVGSFTAIFAASIGLFQNDIKRIIAYSTCSQLGYMVFSCGLSGYDVSFFHLSNHAFFKALLFLSAGSVIHALSDEQDIRKMGGLKNILPFSYGTILIGSLALVGFPFLTGFYSKDTILEIAYAKQTILGHFSYFLGIFAAFFTAFYSTRLIHLVFLTTSNGSKKKIIKAHEAAWQIKTSLFILSFLSIIIGFLTKDLFIGCGNSFWSASIFVKPENYLLFDLEFIHLNIKILPLFVTTTSILMVYFFYSFFIYKKFYIENISLLKNIYIFLTKKWFVDRLYNQTVSQIIFLKSYFYVYKDVDRGLIEKLGPFGLIEITKYILLNIKIIQSGSIYHYLYFFLVILLIFNFLLVICLNFTFSVNLLCYLFYSYILF